MHKIDPVVRDKILKFVSRETLDKLIAFESLFKKWQSRINLTSKSTMENFWKRHVLDSLQVLPIVKGGLVLDVGTGGGFPGLILGISGEVDVTCVECDLRKAAFLREAARDLSVYTSILCDREEFLSCEGFDFVTSRALSKVRYLLEILCRRGKQGVFLKGARVQKEIREAEEFFSFKYELLPSVSSEDGCVLVVSECQQK